MEMLRRKFGYESSTGEQTGRESMVYCEKCKRHRLQNLKQKMVHWPETLIITFKQVNLEEYGLLERVANEYHECLDVYDNKKNVV